MVTPGEDSRAFRSVPRKITADAAVSSGRGRDCQLLPIPIAASMNDSTTSENSSNSP